MPGYDDSAEIDSSFRMTTPPRDILWGVMASLLILALAGGFLGFQNVRTGDIMPTGWVPGSAPAASVAAATPAVAMPKDEKWSTLNGPQVAEPVVPKPARVVHKEEDDDAANAAAPMPDPNAPDGQTLDAPTPAQDAKGAGPDGPPSPQPQ
jgi:hypothetical protein